MLCGIFCWFSLLSVDRSETFIKGALVSLLGLSFVSLVHLCRVAEVSISKRLFCHVFHILLRLDNKPVFFVRWLGYDPIGSDYR